jgi:hypothetical protein
VNGTVYIEKDGKTVQIAIAATSQSCDFLFIDFLTKLLQQFVLITSNWIKLYSKIVMVCGNISKNFDQSLI